MWVGEWVRARGTLTMSPHHGVAAQVFIWSKHYAENYSAFAPNFKELEENEEYIEREDEFDLVDHSTAVRKKLEEEEATEVDITTVEEDLANTKDQLPDIPDELVYLPVVPDHDCDLDANGDSHKHSRPEGDSAHILTKVSPRVGGWVYVCVCVRVYIQAFSKARIARVLGDKRTASRILTYMHTYIHACMHTYINTYISTYMHTYIHAYGPAFRRR